MDEVEGVPTTFAGVTGWRDARTSFAPDSLKAVIPAFAGMTAFNERDLNGVRAAPRPTPAQ